MLQFFIYLEPILNPSTEKNTHAKYVYPLILLANFFFQKEEAFSDKYLFLKFQITY